MEQYIEIGLEVVNILVNNGNDAYLTGSVLRSEQLKIEPREIEILTSATVDSITGCLKSSKSEILNDYEVRIFYRGYQFLITTFRAPLEKGKKKGKTMLSLNYKDALLYRPFTIDALLMRCDKQVIDEFGGCNDLNKKIIKVVGSPKRFKNEPVMILDGIITASETNFKIVSKTLNGMKKAVKGLKNLELSLLYEKVLYILSGNFYKKGLSYLKKIKAFKYLPILGKELSKYENHRKKVKKDEYTFETFLGCSLVTNKKYDENVGKLSDDSVKLKQVVDLALVTKKSKYDKLLLYTYGLDTCLEANKINYILGTANLKKKQITKAYDNLIIKSVCELAFKGEDIIAMCGNQVGDFVQELVDKMVFKVLHKELPNTYEELRQFAITELSAINMLVDPNAKPDPTQFIQEEENKLPIEDYSYKEEIKEISADAYRVPVQSLIRETVRNIVKEAASTMPIYKEVKPVYIEPPKRQIKEIEATVVENEPNINNEELIETKDTISLNAPKEYENPDQEIKQISLPEKEEKSNPLKEEIKISSPLPKEEVKVINSPINEVVEENLPNDNDKVVVDLPPLEKTSPYRSPQRASLKPVVRINDTILPNDVEKPLNENEMIKSYSEKEQIARDYSDMKLSQIERDIWQQEKKIKERDEELKRIQKEALKNELNRKVSDLVNKNMALITDQVHNPDERIKAERNFEKIYRELIISSDARFKIFSGDNK